MEVLLDKDLDKVVDKHHMEPNVVHTQVQHLVLLQLEDMGVGVGELGVEFLAGQHNFVLEVVGDNLLDCLDSCFGPEEDNFEDCLDLAFHICLCFDLVVVEDID